MVGIVPEYKYLFMFKSYCDILKFELQFFYVPVKLYDIQ